MAIQDEMHCKHFYIDNDYTGEFNLYTYPDGHQEYLCANCARMIGFCPSCGAFGLDNVIFERAMRFAGVCDNCLETINATLDHDDDDWDYE